MTAPRSDSYGTPCPESPRFADPVATVMRSHWALTTPESSLHDARQLMRLARIRQLPVMTDDALVGVLHHRDVLRASLARALAFAQESVTQEGLLADLSVAAVMDPQPTTATPDEPIRAVAVRMLRSDAACVPILTNATGAGRMVGLVVESDLLRLAYCSPDARR